MVPPELVELTPCLYSSNLRNASEQTGNEDFPQRLGSLNFRRLLDEECFAQLVAADERFHRPEAGKKILDLAVLINFLRGANDRRRNYLQGARIRHSISLKALRFFAVKNCQNNST